MYGYIKSPIGNLLINEENGYIIEIDFLEDSAVNNFEYTYDNHVIEICKSQLVEYFDGTRKVFSIPFKYETTEFRKRCYDALIQVPYGEVASYKDIAIKIGNEKACRAVGLANNKNNLPIIVPCHRIIGSNQKMVGYAGGIWRKEWLLEFEKRNLS